MKNYTKTGIGLLVIGLGIVGFVFGHNLLSVPQEEIDQSDVMVIDSLDSVPISLPLEEINGTTVTLTPVNGEDIVIKDVVVDNIPKNLPIRTGNFVGVDGHNATGKATVYVNTEGKTLAFEDFSVTSRPDYFVYLSKEKVGSSGFDLTKMVSLGKLKDDSGKQFYTIPDDIKEYQSIIIWCRLFSVKIAESPLE